MFGFPDGGSQDRGASVLHIAFKLSARTSGMPYLVHNERTKLSATLFNTLAVACIVVGFVTPLVTMAMNGNSELGNLIKTVPAWIVVGGVIHFYARSLLGRLRE
jgi:hypothetical protein